MPESRGRNGTLSRNTWKTLQILERTFSDLIILMIIYGFEEKKKKKKKKKSLSLVSIELNAHTAEYMNPLCSTRGSKGPAKIKHLAEQMKKKICYLTTYI